MTTSSPVLQTVKPATPLPANIKIKPQQTQKQTKQKLAAMESLLLLEGELRNAETLQELFYCIANETRKSIANSQTFILRAKGNSFVIDTATNISVIDPNAPAIRFLQKSFCAELQKWQTQKEKKLSFTFTVPQSLDTQISYNHALALPLLDKSGVIYGAVIMLAKNEFVQSQIVVGERLQKAFAHAWLALTPRGSNRLKNLLSKKLALAAASVCFIAMFIPVPLTSLAPVEVVAHKPFIVAAPIDGVIKQIAVEPNSVVKQGDILFSYRDTEFLTSLSIAEKGADVAKARFQTAQQSSFNSVADRRELAIAKAELVLAQSELQHARARLGQTVVRAPLSGLVVFERQSDWHGRPVSVGERVIEIANPKNIEYQIDLSVSDSIVLQQQARVKVFLDSEPLSPKHAVLHQASYRATKSSDENLVFKLYAKPNNENKDDTSTARIGARGTAQVFSSDVALWFYLFRRPLSVVRQFIGW